MRSRWLAAGLAVLAGAFGLIFAGTAANAAPRNVRQAQWYLDPLKIAAAQRITRGAGVTVAVIDTPIDGNHPDLAGQVLQGEGFNGSPGNGWAADRSAVHGTEMASLIVGKGGDNNHLLGIAPDARVLPVSTGLVSNAQATADAIRWAAGSAGRHDSAATPDPFHLSLGKDSQGNAKVRSFYAVPRSNALSLAVAVSGCRHGTRYLYNR